ncbi:MAG: toxin ParE1/3/4 [Verrucomicrobiales bacterium]
MGYLVISRLAAYDLEEIENYSIERWGEQVAARYMGSIELALRRLRDNPSLLKESARISDDLRLYRVEKHFLVCALVEESVYVLTVKHGAMDLPERIGELEPVLRQEAEILHQAFLDSRK